MPGTDAGIAATTRRVRIGTACIVPAFHSPINLAEQIAMVDVISGGRFEAGRSLDCPACHGTFALAVPDHAA